tara:strand:+ start:492 stop:1349 length:858 start_codon:yes stop_codon:yes gene_type:complete
MIQAGNGETWHPDDVPWPDIRQHYPHNFVEFTRLCLEDIRAKFDRLDARGRCLYMKLCKENERSLQDDPDEDHWMEPETTRKRRALRDYTETTIEKFIEWEAEKYLAAEPPSKRPKVETETEKKTEEKAEEDKAEEDKAEEDKAEEDKAEEDKAEEDKAEEDKAEEDKAEGTADKTVVKAVKGCFDASAALPEASVTVYNYDGNSAEVVIEDANKSFHIDFSDRRAPKIQKVLWALDTVDHAGGLALAPSDFAGRMIKDNVYRIDCERVPAFWLEIRIKELLDDF